MSLEKDITEIKILIEQTEKFTCPQCGVSFGSRTGFSEHMIKKHSGKTYDLSLHKPGCLCSFCKAKRGEYAGENNPSFGIHPSEDILKKMSAARTGKTYTDIYGEEEAARQLKLRSEEGKDRIWSEERKQNVSTAMTGRKLSAAHKQKLSDIWDVGHTAEVINKMNTSSRAGYKRGSFKSHKNNCDIHFQSSYELYTYICLEHDDEVQSYSRCNFSIPYTFNGKIRRHVPDVDIRYKDGSRKILEIKPTRLSNTAEVIAKRTAGEKYCEEHGMSYEMHTEEEIQSILDKRN